MNKMNVPALVRRAHQKKKGLAIFLKKLNRNQPKNIQAYIKEADTKAFAETPCLDCANCCKTMTPTFKKSEIRAIAARIGMDYQKYFDKYLKVDDESGDIVNVNTPCQHLGKDNKCRVYDIRPYDCRHFPHHIRKDFFYQVTEKTYINNLPRCPATLRFVENLEKIVHQNR